MNAPASLPGREFEQLKQLLLQTETERLNSLEAKVDHLDERVGTPEKLEAATGEVLANAFRQAEANSPRELAKAVAPSILSTIQAEIRNSRNSIIETLYPVAGRLVTAAVANAFKDLVAALQQQIDALISVNQWRWRFQSLVTGRPVSEIALASIDYLRISRLFLIERGSGRLLSSWSSQAVAGENRDIVSGMISAIIDFSSQAFEGSGTLRTIDFGGRAIALRASARAIIAAECVGPLKSSDNSRIDAAFLAFVDSMEDGRPVGEADLGRLVEAIQPVGMQKPDRGTGKLVLRGIAAIAVLAMLWFAGTALLHGYRERQVLSALNAEIERQPALKSYPLRLDYDHGQRTVALSGLLPAKSDEMALTRTVASAALPYALVSHLAVAADAGQVTALQARINSLLLALADAQGKSQNLQSLLDKLQGDTSDRFALDQKEIGDLKSTVDNPAQRLARHIAETAIFFGNAAEYLDPAAAEQALNGIADLLKGNNLSLRVVGYADEVGAAENNRQVARRRAEVVVADLVARGIDASRLNIVSRSASLPISEVAGGDRPGNRRVVFERLFKNEKSR